jgi:hypothetical protein
MVTKKKEAAPAAEEETKVDAAVEETVAEETAAAPAKKAKVTGPITVKYLDHEGRPTERTFSADVHGEDFAALADEFKGTNASRLIKDEA